METQYKVVICGLGRVGAGAPSVQAGNGDKIIRNHLDAVLSLGAEISALVDPSEVVRREVASKVPGVCDSYLVGGLSDLPVGVADVIVLATPPQDRCSLVEIALALKPKVLLIEKPLALSLKEALEIEGLLRKSATVTRISFNRRVDSGMVKFFEESPQERPISVLFRYSKGLLNYGIHIIDHIVSLFGEVSAVQADPGRTIDPDSMSVGFRCCMKSGLVVNVLGVPHAPYDLFEGEFFYKDCVRSFKNNGVEKNHYAVSESLYYPGYLGMFERQSLSSVQPIGGFVEMHERIKDYVLTGAGDVDQLCDINDALHCSMVVDGVLQSAKSDGATIRVS